MNFRLKLLLISFIMLDGVFVLGLQTDNKQDEHKKINISLASNEQLLAHAKSTKGEMVLFGWDYRGKGSKMQAVGVMEVVKDKTNECFGVAIEFERVQGQPPIVKVFQGIPLGALGSLKEAILQVEAFKNDDANWPLPIKVTPTVNNIPPTPDKNKSSSFAGALGQCIGMCTSS